MMLGNILVSKAAGDVGSTPELVNVFEYPDEITANQYYYGWEVAADDNYFAVSATSAKNTSGYTVGRIDVYNRKTGEWLYKIYGPASYGGFGNQMVIHGGDLLVGFGYNTIAFVGIYDISTGTFKTNMYGYQLSSNAGFGKSIDQNDNFFIVGAPGQIYSGNNGAGRVELFRKKDYTRYGYYNNPNITGTHYNDQFGASVAASPTRIYMSIPREDRYVSDSGYVWVLKDTSASPDAPSVQSFKYLHPPGTSAALGTYYNFGHSIACNDTHVAISAFGHDNGTGYHANRGAIHIYDHETTTLQHTIINPTDMKSFGSGKMHFDDEFLIVGCTPADNGNGVVLIYSSETFELLHVINSPNNYDSARYDGFGISVARFGNSLFIGANGEGTVGGWTFNGVLYEYNLEGKDFAGSVTLKDNLTYPDTISKNSIQYGKIMDSNNRLHAISAPHADDGFTENGKVFVYDSGHSLNYSLSGSADNENFGKNIHIEDEFLFVGTNDKIRAYDSETGTYVKEFIPPEAQQADSVFGHKIQRESNYLVCSSYKQDGPEAGEGVVYVYTVSSGVIKKIITNPFRPGAKTDSHFGKGLLFHGYVIFVGAPGLDDNFIDSGKIFMFDDNGISQGTIENPSSDPNDKRFGDNIVANNTHLFVSASKHSSVRADAGAIYVYALEDLSLVDTIHHPSSGTLYGEEAMYADNEIFVVGCPDVGETHVYNAKTFELIKILNNPNPYGTAAGDEFGYSIIRNKQNLYIGARTEDPSDPTFTDTGVIYRYEVK